MDQSFHEQLTLLNSSSILQLSKKVDIVMSAIDDLHAAEAELSAVVDQAVAVIGELHTALEAASSGDTSIAEVAARLRNLKDVLSSHIGA